MTDFSDVLARETAEAARAADADVLRGREANSILSSHLVEGYFATRTHDLVISLMDCDPTDTGTIQVIAIGLRALRDQHRHFTRAIADGEGAVMRLAELAQNGGLK